MTSPEPMSPEPMSPEPMSREPMSRERNGSAWRLVAVREILVKLGDRNFLIGTGITIALLLGLLGVQAFLVGRTQTVTLGVLDADARAVAEATHERVHALDSQKVVTPKDFADPAAAREALRADDLDAVLAHDGQVWRLTSRREADTRLLGELQSTITQRTMAERASASGTSMTALTAGSTVVTEPLEGSGTTSDGVRQAVAYVFAMLFYMAAVMFGMQIASSVVEEKQSRIVEILATAIPVRQLLIGKIVGNTAIALGQMVLYVGVGLVGLAVTGRAESVPLVARSSGWFLAFFLAGFVALACAWAVAGSLASRTEDLQSTSTPITLILVGAFILGFSVQGVARTVASFVPVISSIVMPGRVVSGDAAWWEPFVSLALTLALAAVMVRVGERLYRRSVLATGGRVRLRTAWTAR